MIGAYMIVYKEPEWAAFNIRRMYDRFDEISVVVGPVRHLMGSDLDTETAFALSAMPDPDRKIRVRSGAWKDKNEMTTAAVAELKSDIIFQLDADEFWPDKAFEEALRRIKKGARKLKVHMYTFWKSPGYIMETIDVPGWGASQLRLNRTVFERAIQGSPTARAKIQREFRARDKVLGADKKRSDTLRLVAEKGGLLGQMLSGPWTPWLLDMHRVFAPDPVTRISHIPPDLVYHNRESAYVDQGFTLTTPIWHFSYVGKERMRRKCEFFTKRGDGDMPPAEYFDTWDESSLGAELRMTGQRRRIVRYPGPAIPEDIRDFAKGQG